MQRGYIDRRDQDVEEESVEYFQPKVFGKRNADGTLEKQWEQVGVIASELTGGFHDVMHYSPLSVVLTLTASDDGHEAQQARAATKNLRTAYDGGAQTVFIRLVYADAVVVEIYRRVDNSTATPEEVEVEVRRTSLETALFDVDDLDDLPAS